MQLEHSFTVPVGVDEAWRLLRDPKVVGACAPGARIESAESDGVLGLMKVKLGPLNLTYRGTATFLEQNAASRRFVGRADGVDARGNGTATAVITATLHDVDGGQTRVQVETELDFTGKPASFSRSVMVDVGDKLFGQFAANLAATIRGEPLPANRPPKKAAKKPAKRPAKAPAENIAVAETAIPETATPEQPIAADQPAPEMSVSRPAATPDTPAFATPGTLTAPTTMDEEPSMNGHSTPRPAAATSARTRADLAKAARPYVAKGLGPAAVGLVIVLAVARRRRSGRA